MTDVEGLIGDILYTIKFNRLIMENSWVKSVET